MASQGQDHLEVFKLIYADVREETARIRNARSSFTNRLGPISAAAAIGITVITGAVSKVALGVIIVALVLFLLLSLVGMLWYSLPPYRFLRFTRQRALERDPETGLPVLAPSAESSLAFFMPEASSWQEKWLVARIRLEEDLYGRRPPEEPAGPLRELRKSFSKLLKARDKENGLQELLEAERAAFILGQVVLLLIVLDLVIGVAVA